MSDIKLGDGLIGPEKLATVPEEVEEGSNWYVYYEGSVLDAKVLRVTPKVIVFRDDLSHRSAYIALKAQVRFIEKISDPEPKRGFWGRVRYILGI